ANGFTLLPRPQRDTVRPFLFPGGWARHVPPNRPGGVPMSSSVRIAFLAALILAIGLALSGLRDPAPVRNAPRVPAAPQGAESSDYAAAVGIQRTKVTLGTQIAVENAEFSANDGTNQERADAVAAALRQAKLSGFEIDIKAVDDVVTLEGH